MSEKKLKEQRELYSRKYNFKFYHCTKNAMTSMIKTCVDRDWELIQQIPDSANTVAILRDPIDRFVSGLSYVRKRKHRYNFSKEENRYYQRDLLRPVSKKIDLLDSKNPMDHANAILDEQLEYGFFDDHLSPQTYFFNLKTNVMRWKVIRDISDINIFLQFENLNREARDKINPSIRMIHDNKGDNRYKKHYIKVVEDRMDDFLSLYKEDVELYTSHFNSNYF
jgi:hypothetical protein